jgi:two-component system, OmpR family, phosphate regulon response regulator OmpR
MTGGARILVVDDEPDLRALLADYLGMQGYAVGAAADAVELDARLAEAPADVIVLDINMPGENGLQALARLRAGGLGAGVILLTAAGTLGDRVAGLGDGADDYIVKPFAPRALLARIRAVLRRLEAAGATAPAPAAAPPPKPLLRIGRCAFDTEARCLRAEDGTEIALTAMEYDLLSVFARHPRQTLSRSRLAELAHGRPLAPGDRSIDIRITRLRGKIGEDARAPKTLRTIHGEGYVFDPDA